MGDTPPEPSPEPLAAADRDRFDVDRDGEPVAGRPLNDPLRRPAIVVVYIAGDLTVCAECNEDLMT